MGTQNFEILVEDSKTGGPSSISVRMEYSCFSILILGTWCGKPEGKTESFFFFFECAPFYKVLFFQTVSLKR